MKRILTFMATAILCCSCILDDGHDSHHNSQNLRMYSKSMIERHIIQPLGYVDMMVKLDDYLNASEEERLLDKHAFIRNGLVKKSAETYAVYYYGTIYTGGRSFRDPEGEWRTSEISVKPTSESSWHVSETYSQETDMDITLAGTAENGEYIYDIVSAGNESQKTESANGDEISITSSISMPEGPLRIYHLDVDDNHYSSNLSKTKAEGKVRIDIRRNGSPQDWIEVTFLTGAQNNTSYGTSLDR